MSRTTKAIFVQINAPHRLPGVHWNAILYEDDEATIPFPLALAWVSDFGVGDPFGPYLDFVLVPDHLRRMGYATELVRLCFKRWPGLMLTDAISELGHGFLVAAARNFGEAR